MKSSARLACMMTIAVGGALATFAAPKAAPYPPAQMAAPSHVQGIGWACGPGWHLDPWGRCVPNRWRGPYWRGHYGWRGYPHWRHHHHHHPHYW